MGRTPNLRTDNLHVKIREKHLKDESSQKVLDLVGNDKQHHMEKWVNNMLAQKSGPTKVLDILYEAGSARQFFDLLHSLEGEGADARTFDALIHEKVACLESLSNLNERYYSGNLRVKGGNVTTCMGRVTLTGEAYEYQVSLFVSACATA